MFNTGGSYLSGGVDHSENVRLCMRACQTDETMSSSRFNRNKSSSFSLPKPNTPYANRSTSGYLGFGPFEPNKSPGIPNYCSMKDPCLDDYFTRKFSRMLSPHLPLRDMYHSSLEVDRLQLRSATVRGSSYYSEKSEVLYKVAVTTADIKGAGTSVPIFITIRGDKGHLPRTRLKKIGKQKKKKNSIQSVKMNPGSTNVFPIRCSDLGDIESLLVEHDGLEPKDSWLLQGIEIMNTKNKKIWLFTCNHWLSLYKEDGRVSRELFANKSMRTKYEIVVVTGDVSNGGTEGPVFITLFGRTGVSPQLKLGGPEDDSSESESEMATQQNRKRKVKGYFNKGQSSRFVIPATCVGPITKVRIRLDENVSNEESWFLDRVCVTDLKHPDWRYYFSCKNWFSRNHGDGAIARDIRGTKEISGIASKTSYKISIFTSDKSGAGTRANVFLKIFGSNGESGVVPIQTNGAGFPEGSIVEHVLTCKQLGTLIKIKLGHDGAGPQSRWNCDKVIINDMDLSRVFEFPCGQWFSNNPGEQLVRELTARKQKDEYSNYKYEIYLTTSNRNKQPTTSRVFINMKGPETEEEQESKKRKKGSSEENKLLDSGNIWIKGALYEKGRTDKIIVELSQMLSPVKQVHMGLIPGGKYPDWFLDDVVVYCPTSGIEQTFVWGNWLSNTREGCSTEGELLEDLTKRKYKELKEQWEISIFTSDIKDANTSSNVTMVLYGKEKKTEDIMIKSQNNDMKLFQKGSKDIVKTDITPVGTPYKLRVQHDNSGSNASWHLEKVIMKQIASNREYMFHCDKWLSESRNDHATVRELPAEGPGILEIAQICMYRVQIYTGNKKYSGTDANVFINLFGDISDSGDRRLTHSLTNKNKFEKAQMDEFMIEAVDLGQIYKIKLGHDGKMAGAGWYVDKVIVTQEDNPGNSMTFRAQCWFDVNEGDGLIVRELTGASFLGKITYEVHVKTGTSTGAGTDANVFIRIMGSRGDSGEVQLKQSDQASNKFEAGNTDTFKVEVEDLGEIKSIKLSHDDKGAGSAWQVDKVLIFVREVGLKYVFIFNEWLDKKKLAIEKDPTTIEKIDKGIPYQVTVFTGDVRQAGTDANVFIQIYGKNKKTDKIPLKNRTNNFEKGESDVFKIYATDVERIEKIRIGHDGKGAGAGWFLDKVLIEKLCVNTDKSDEKSIKSASKRKLERSRSVSSDDSRSLDRHESIVPRRSLFIKKGVEEEMEVYWFFCHRWLATDEEDGMLVVELLPMDEDGRPLSDKREIEYRVLVKTGNVNGAGTDANIFLVIYGEDMDSGERMLKDTVDKTANKFEKNKQDEFIIKAIDMGRLKRIKIRHDNAGGGAAWYLDYVLISDDSNNDYLFPCYNWLSKKDGDGQICREIFVASSSALSKLRQNTLSKEDFKMQQEDKLESYKIAVYTSNKRFSGTDANVDIILYGESNDSDVVPLKTSLTHMNKFEKGNCDEFDVKLNNLGELKKVRIRQDGTGGNSDWHLEKVIVTANKQGKSWVFPCNEWLSKNQRERDLYPQEGLTQVGRPRITYEITTYTGNLSGASTSANVYIQIYGRQDATEKRNLDTSIDGGGHFSKGAVDKFYLDMEDIEEPIEKVRIGHDNSGLKPGWYLEKVLVKRMTSGGKNAVTHVFNCQRWLARSEDDRAIERELLPTKIVRAEEVDGESIEREEDYQGPNQKKKYTINVVTGNETGTDANVFMKIYGDNGDTGERQLKYSETNTNKFEKNSTDRFTWEAVDLGRLYRVDIRHDNSAFTKNSWFLKEVEIIDETDKETYMFRCEKWLSTKKEDKKIRRTLYVNGFDGDRSPSESKSRSRYGGSSMVSFDSTDNASEFIFEEEDDEEISKLPTIPYTVTVTTGSKENMGSSGPIWIRFFGPNSKRTKKIRLQKYGTDYFSPGTKEVLSLQAADVDSIKEIEIGNEGVDEKSSWFLANLKVEMPTKGRVYTINCGTWLSRFESDHLQCRKFPIADRMMKVFEPKITYKITIITGDVDSAGTSSSLFLQLFGVNRSSNLYLLEKLENRFERGGKDQFNLEMEDVGEIKRIRLQNDGNGERPHWFLESIQIENDKTSELYRFEYNDFLSNTLGQKKQLSIDLAPVGESQAITYLIRTKTSDIKGAETSANVFVKLIGEFGDSGDLALRNHIKVQDKKPFQKGELDEFEVPDIISLGELCRCLVWHDGKAGVFSSGEKWHLEFIEIQEILPRSVTDRRKLMGNTYRFPCNKWLSMTEDDGQVLRDLLCESVPKRKQLTKYGKPGSAFEVTVITGDRKNAGMPHHVWLIFHGTLSYSEVYQMLNNNGNSFSKGATETIKKVEFPSIGELREITLGAFLNRDYYGEERNKWYCNEIQLKDLNTLKTYIFEVRKWIKVQDRINEYEGELLSISKEIEDPGKKKVEEIKRAILIKYEVIVITGDVLRAGTNANVFLTIYGEKGDSGKRALVQKGRDLFERKQEDRFELECVDLGSLSSIKIEHDNSGLSADWYLEKVIIKNMTTSASYTFMCQAWLSKSKGDGQLWKIIEL